MVDDQFMATLAVALAGKVADGLAEAGRVTCQGLVRLVRRRFRSDPAAEEALEAAEADPSDSGHLDRLRAALERLAAEDPAFDTELRALWREVQPHLAAASGGVVNMVSGDVRGGVVQARDVHGGITFGSD